MEKSCLFNMKQIKYNCDLTNDLRMIIEKFVLLKYLLIQKIKIVLFYYINSLSIAKIARLHVR